MRRESVNAMNAVHRVSRVASSYALTACCSFALFAGLSCWRFQNDLSQQLSAGTEGSFRGSRFDPRGFARVDEIQKERESESFKNRLRNGSSSDLSWPGLASAQVSWTWLELLQGIHEESSYQGDFSWMFSKLNTVARNSPKKEQYFVSMLGAFFYATGRDFPGATLIMQETLERGGDRYNPWFWCGYHAYFNLKNNALAADCWGRAARFPNGPPYLASLMVKLKYGQDVLKDSEKRKVLEKELEPDLLEKLDRARRR